MTEPASQRHSFVIDIAADRALPLFTAEGERNWVPGWAPEILSGNGERGSVFRTTSDGVQTVWIVTDFRPDLGRASYARIAQGSNMGLVDVQCEPVDPDSTRVTVTYTLTGLNAEGVAFASQFLDPQAYKRFIGEWQQAIDAALRTGTITR